MKRFAFATVIAALAGFLAARAQEPSPNASHGPVVFPSGTNTEMSVAPAQDPEPATGPVHSVVMPPQDSTPTPQQPGPASPVAMPPQTPLQPGPAGPGMMPPQGLAAPMPGPNAPTDDIRDIRAPFFYLHSWVRLWVALGIALLVVLIVLLWKWLKSPTVINPRSAYDLALEKLEKARALLDEQNPEPYAVVVSETVRSYLSQRFQTPSTRRTTEEFLRQMQADAGTPLAEHRALLRGFLESCDLVKFAHYQPTRDELEDVQQRAVTFVTATNPSVAPAQNGRHP